MDATAPVVVGTGAAEQRRNSMNLERRGRDALVGGLLIGAVFGAVALLRWLGWW